MTVKVFRQNFSAYVLKMALELYKYYKPCRKAVVIDPRKLISATANIFQGKDLQPQNFFTANKKQYTVLVRKWSMGICANICQ